MSLYRYVVSGAGRQGTAAIHDLIENCEASDVLVVEPDAARARTARARLTKLLGRRARSVRWSAEPSSADLRAAHVWLSCAPYAVNLELTRRALQAKLAFCDLGGNPDVVARQERLARGRSTAVVPDCGVSPGLSNILAAHLARAHGCTRVAVRCGGLPLARPDARTNPLQYKLVFSPWGLISEYSGDVPVLRDGKLAHVAALSSTEIFDDEHESAPTSNNSPQVVRYLAQCGVRDYDYMTVRYRGHWDLVRGWKSLGYLQGDEVRDRELAARLEADPVLRYDERRDRDKLILRVGGFSSARGLRRGHEYRFDIAADRRTKFSAMELSTSWGITIVAHQLASGRASAKGFATPERFIDGEALIRELEKRLAQLK